MLPLPLPTADAQEFWDACRRHELRIQQCAACGTHRFHPRPACPRCTSLDARWVACSGRGTVFTWTIVHPPTLPAFRDLVPYAVGLVALDEGVFMVGQIRGVDPHAVRAGMPVRVEFDDVSADVSLPHWRVA